MFLCAGVNDVVPGEVAKIVSSPKWFFKVKKFSDLRERTKDVIEAMYLACE